jgi:isocitrate dehydrogenase
MPNLYGDVLSDVAAQIAGSVGLAGSSNIGENVAMFEAIHGSAPRRAGQNLANPSGLFLGAILMLVHIGQQDVAEKAHNAWLRTIEDGVHTYDIFKEGTSKEKVGTKEFAEAVVARLGQKPETLKAVEYKQAVAETGEAKPIFSSPAPQKKELVGVDVFLDWWKGSYYGTANELGALVEAVSGDGLKLQTIANRGVKVYPGGNPDTFTVDHWRCRFVAEAGEGNTVDKNQLISLQQRFNEAGLDVIKTENLYNFDGAKGYSA